MSIINQEKVKQVPTKPGVYFFKSVNGEIIYIGKAKHLRNRVKSYFQKSKHQSAKNISMIKRIADIEWIVVNTEVEALLTEANLIKQHQPHYNINLRDDKSFPYIRITKEPYPRVFITREIIRDGSKYFGPYTDVRHLRRSLKAVHKIFPLRSCDYLIDDKSILNKKVSLCLDYHIKKCEGPCEGMVSEKEYNIMIKQVIQFLQGRTKETESYIHSLMKKSSLDMRFEDAAMYRDQLDAIVKFKDQQRKVASDFEDRDVFALAKDEDYGIAVIVRIRNGRITSREKISLRNIDESDAVMMETIISRFYLESDFIPKEISLPCEPLNKAQLIYWLKEKRAGAIKLQIPQKGERAKEVRLAFQNAKLLLGEWLINRKKRMELVPKMINQLQDDLHLKAPPRRIEAFDISHLGGTNTVASMVCFIDGKPRRTQYRKFKVKTVKGIDDFASMREIVYRRYKRVKKEGVGFPDLILIDGGKPQLNAALQVFDAPHISPPIVLSIVKGANLVRATETIIAKEGILEMPLNSPAFILLQQVRDESHRFAILSNRRKKNKSIKYSVLNNIPGLGPMKKQKMLNHFKSIKAIKNASIQELCLVDGISIKLSTEIKKFISSK